MKDVIKEFNDRTAQRFEEYNERMQVKKNQCKEQCDKEIQQIILKDKIEKELTERFSALETKIDTNDILTCICEKSVADKVEKTCLKCGRILGTAVPELSLIGGIAVYAAAQSATMKAFISETIDGLNGIGGMSKLFGAKIEEFFTLATYDQPMTLVTTILSEKEKLCLCVANKNQLLCRGIESSFAQTLPARIEGAVNQGVYTANHTWATATTPTTFLTNPFVASSIAIMIIVAIVLIIYFILRYRRKQKIKKKIQYIKLLKE
ncbi:hypothetical protein PFNF135_01699 [Plasmodium falciparum NF135/5.C10]|uniref:Surface antigen n=1 Tax=Plasmodium falciparum NF135/5.C10 TaxID=1036726 RepID=W4ILF0_PLAFA|nr:hypothetical protein PFNF135_01699 [Plasmodium falciparum NF135/5.C10]